MHVLKTVIRVTQVSVDESMGSVIVIGGWGAAGATPRAQGKGGDVIEPHIPITTATRPYPGIALFFLFLPSPSIPPPGTNARTFFFYFSPGGIQAEACFEIGPGTVAPLFDLMHFLYRKKKSETTFVL
jgi:hypothetical protein